MKKLISLGMLLAFVLTSFQASASLITNGSFEDFGMQPSPESFTDGYGVYSTIPGWTGFESLEIHPSGFLGNTSQDGSYHAELNANPGQQDPFRLEQTFNTVAGNSYQLSFWAQKREEDDGSFEVSLSDGGVIAALTVSSHVVDAWTEFVLDFKATGEQTLLSFKSGQLGSDTVGHFIDDVKVVPIPGAAILLLGGLLGLTAFRRKNTISA